MSGSSGRTCLECAHWIWEAGYPGYSEYTPGDDARMGCRAGHWTVDMYGDGRGDVRDKLSRAAKCADFKPETP